jgi:tRNA(Ile)-lysidine synthase
MTLPTAFREHLESLDLPGGRALVAVSGGPDSVALLDLMHRTRDLHRLELVVAHFDHGIHPESGRVSARVRALAESLGCPHQEGRGALGADAGETAARAARYAWLETTRARLGAQLVVTAHHADDQVETVLMRVLSGSGPAGLAAMRSRSGTLVRPLLPVRHAELVEYVRSRGLSAWLDPANEDPRHLRSWLRTRLLPALRERLPDVDQALLRTGAQAALDRSAWDAALGQLPGLDFRPEPDGFSVAAPVLGGYDSALGAALLMAAARRVGCRLGPGRADRLVRLARRGRSGAKLELAGDWMGELAFDRLLVSRVVRDRPPGPWTLAGRTGERTWGRWRFRWQQEPAPEEQPREARSGWFTTGPLLVRRPLAGERIRPLGGTGRRLLVRCFQDARIPRSRRGEWPVLAATSGVVWLPGVCRSDALVPAPGTEALRVDAHYA